MTEADDSTGFVLAAVVDLFFLVQIQDAAKRAGLQLQQARDSSALLAIAARKPRLIVVDLHATAVEPIGTIRSLKADDQLRDIPVLAYLSHVQVDLGRQAKDAGADFVSAKSALLRTLSQILTRIH